jgi:hypothetical protein
VVDIGQGAEGPSSLELVANRIAATNTTTRTEMTKKGEEMFME